MVPLGLQSARVPACCWVQCDEHLRPEPGRCDAEMDGGTENFLVSDASTFRAAPNAGPPWMKENIERAGGGQELGLLFLSSCPALC